MCQILVMQHYSRNKGNVSLLYALVESLKRHIPEANVVISSFDPPETKAMFGFECCEWPFCTRLIMETKGAKRYYKMLVELYYILLQIVVAVLIRLRLISPSNLGGRLSILKIFCESDVLISPGGHLFTNFNSFVGVFAHFYPCLLSVIMRCKYVMLAQTLGPFYGPMRAPTIIMTRFLVKHAAYVSVRELYSLETLKKVKIDTSHIAKTNELVFLLHDEDNLQSSAAKAGKKAKPLVGVTFHHIYYRRWMNKEDYISRMVGFIKKVIDRYDYQILFIPMEKSSPGDLPLLREIQSKLTNAGNVSIAEVSMGPRDLLKLVRSLDFLCATKTHSVVYGLRMGIPTLGIAYDDKTAHFMGDFQQGKYSIPLKTLSADKAYNLFIDLVAHQATVREQLRKSLPKIQNQALENIHAIRRLLQYAK